MQKQQNKFTYLTIKF